MVDQEKILEPEQYERLFDFPQARCPAPCMPGVFQALKGRIASNAALAAERFGPVIGGQVYNAVSAGAVNERHAVICPWLASGSDAVKPVAGRVM